MKKYRSVFAITFCAILTLFSCDKEELTMNKLLGTWEWVSDTSYYADSSIEVEYANKANNWHCLTFSDKFIEYEGYDIEDPIMTKYKYAYSCSGNIILLLGGIVQWEIEDLTNKNLKVKVTSALNADMYTIRAYKKK